MKEVFDLSKFDEYKEDNRREVKSAKGGLTVKVDEFSSAIGVDDAAKAKEIADEIVVLVGDRNKKCKALK